MKTYFPVLLIVALPILQVQGFSIRKMFNSFIKEHEDFHKLSDYFTRRARNTDNSSTIEIGFLERQINNTNVKNGENVLRWQLASLKISSPETILALIDSEENCFKLKEMIATIEENCDGCHLLSNTSLYIRLYEGAKKFNSLFCLNQEIKQKIMLYQACFKDLREEFIDCEGEGDWFENSNVSSVCDTCKSIIECDYVRTAEECGEDAAFYLTCLAKAIFEEVLVPTCRFPKLKELEKTDEIEAAKFMQGISSNGISLKISFASVILFLIHFILF